MKPKKALLIIGIQNDFCPGGSLAVKDGDKIIPVINEYIKLFSENELPIFLSRDWHPKIRKQGLHWPRHCIQDTEGAMFHPDLQFPHEAITLSKEMDPGEESYSVFKAIDPIGTLFASLLGIRGIEELFICGLPADYGVKSTALDALRLGFKVKLLVDAIKGLDIKPGDSEAAVKTMLSHGAKEMTFEQACQIFT